MSKALGATGRNLDAAPPHAMNSLSMAPRWVYGRRLELETRAFTLSVRRESSYLNARCASFTNLPVSTTRRVSCGAADGDTHPTGAPLESSARPIRILRAEAPAELQRHTDIASVRGTDNRFPRKLAG